MISEEQLADLQAKYSRIKHVVYNGTDLVFRAPSVAECDQHATQVENGGSEKVFADRLLSQILIVVCGDATGPDARLAYLKLLEQYPYAWRSAPVGAAIAKLTGVVQDDAVKGDGSASKPNGSPQMTTPRA